MTDNYPFSNEDFISGPAREQALNIAIGDIEQALLRFEKIMIRHLPAIKALSSRQNKRSVFKSGITKGLINVFEVLARPSPDFRTVYKSDSSQTNRFPASSGQLLTDLWSQLGRFSGRNL
jgi:hypothetical protein